ncbi:MAG: hypothetical protein K2X86_08125, partial [Cytophagaceae bacterium]|nr:hypothetical protein [Cytophagaceae bacterium]
MQNDPELNGKYLGTITRDFIKIADTLKEASYQMRVRKISEYPIFPMSKMDIPVGKLLIGKQEVNLEWNYYISLVEEFVQRKLVVEDKLQDFKNAYKNPEEFCCLFVVDADFTNFLFIPYPE